MTLRSLNQSVLSSIAEQSERFERSAAQVTRLAGAPSAAETAETVDISPEARRASEEPSGSLGGGLQGALVDLRVAKYAFMASLAVVKTSAELEKTAADLIR